MHHYVILVDSIYNSSSRTGLDTKRSGFPAEHHQGLQEPLAASE